MRTYLPIAGMEFNLLLLVLIGFAVGVLAAFFGMGGGWVVTPALNALGLPMPFAIGTGLANIAGQSAIATVKHRKMGNVDYRLGLIVGLFMVVGVEGGAQVVMWLESLGLAEGLVRWIYIAFLTTLSIYMLTEYRSEMRRRAAEGGGGLGAVQQGNGLVGGFKALRAGPSIKLRSCDVRLSIWVPAALGVGIGFLAGLMGTGGGFALVPSFVYVIGMPTVVAVGTSLTCVMISGAYGAFSYALKGRVEVLAALWMLLGAAFGAQLGGVAVRWVRGYGIRLLYALMLLMAAAGVLLKQFGQSVLAGVAILGGALTMCVLIIGKTVLAARAERAENA
ncbi:MAG: sulfite exporter TauE/SafE family protein [Planctomycetota bacterium]